IVQTAGGNAFYLEELIRSVSVSTEAASRAIAGDATAGTTPPTSVGQGRRSTAPVVLPETVLTMVQARLEALQPEARGALRAASVSGQLFGRGGAIALRRGTRASELPPAALRVGGEHEATQVTAWLEELAVREIITRREQPKFRGEVEYVFRHSFVAEA